MKILVTGLTSSAWGGMEFQNLGNYIIVEPLFLQLRKEFPTAEIVTTIQMSDNFYTRHHVRALKNQRFWTYGSRTAKETIKDAAKIALYTVFRSQNILNGALLSELKTADLVVDFSGDIYGDNARWNKFLEGNAKLLFALLLNKPIAMLIGSPGPFSSFWRQWLAKKILPRLDLITNREPLSTPMLAYIGIKGENIKSTACPSVFFQEKEISQAEHSEDYSAIIDSDRPVAGLILCGWNMPVAPFNKWPREDWEFDPFIELVDYLLENTDHRICLMAHQNSVDPDGNLQKGNDHRIIDKFVELLGDRHDSDRVYKLENLYTAAESKFIISHFDFLVSGRIHGAVQAMSQAIPTVIIDYGHEPRAHKLAGFARLYGVDDYLVRPNMKGEVTSGVSRLLQNKRRVQADLADRIPVIKERALKNYKLLKDLI